MQFPSRMLFAVWLAAAGILLVFGATTVRAQMVKQETFSSPAEALHALVQAAEAKDHVALHRIFGPEYAQLLSGDKVEDEKDLNDFARGLAQSAQLQKQNDSFIVLVGETNWPFPVPIEKQGNAWIFDTKGGLQQILDRRIGENELSAITTARAYVVAQWQYFNDDDWGHDGVSAYAQEFISTPGQHNGLYWNTASGDPPSPLGSLVAEARAEGYGSQNRAQRTAASRASAGHHPFHGYYFRILTRQGPHAPGGKYSYIINGNMIAGFALIAYPDKWGNSGVMTFIVNQQGRVYEKNLGPNTDKIAGTIAAYDPDPSWKMVNWHMEETAPSPRK